MVVCAVYGCKNRTGKTKGSDLESKISFSRFPIKEPKDCKAWVVFCRRSDKFNCKTSRICSAHFEASCFQWNLQHRLLNYSPKMARKVAPGSIPTLNGPKVSSCSAVTEKSCSERQLRGDNRSAKKFKNELIKSLAASSSTSISENFQNNISNEKDRIADATPAPISQHLNVSEMKAKIELLESENARLESENIFLLDKLKKSEQNVKQLTPSKIAYLLIRPIKP